MKQTQTEEQLSTAFEAAILSGDLGYPYPAFTHVSKELHCKQGRPDFVASPIETVIIPESLGLEVAKALSTPSIAKILSLLKVASPRSSDYIVRASGLSVPVVRRAISSLESLKLIQKINGSAYILSPESPSLEYEFWAFEVKVENWRRALFQALQCRAFAHYVAVVYSKRWAHRIEQHIDKFKAFKVGVIIVDGEVGDIRFALRPAKRPPASRFHYLYALGKFLYAQYCYSP